MRGSSVWCSGVVDCPEGVGKEDYSDISKVYYLRCKKTMDQAHSKG